MARDLSVESPPGLQPGIGAADVAEGRRPRYTPRTCRTVASIHASFVTAGTNRSAVEDPPETSLAPY
jgi:hypothetical protein